MISTRICWMALLGGLALSLTARGEDAQVASALAASAGTLSAQGLNEKAKALCYKALAHDPDCPEALYELGRLLQAEGRAVRAGEFLVRAGRLLEKERSDAGRAAKLADAQQRVRMLNPYAVRMGYCLEEYALELTAVLKQLPDSLTREEIGSRLASLRLSEWVADEKLPRPEKGPAAAPPNSGPGERKGPPSVPPLRNPPPEPKATPGGVPLDVERALKQQGWTTISGSWSRKGTHLYEVTNGRLEAQKKNGAVSVIVHSGGSGSVSLFVRNGASLPKEARPSPYQPATESATGFGVRLSGNHCAIFAPTSSTMLGSGTPSGPGAEVFYPTKDHDLALPPGSAKNQLLVQLQDLRLEISVNGKREKLTRYKLPDTGPFAILIDGTMTIEMPQVGGQ